MKLDRAALMTVREYLEEMMYSLVDFRLLLEAGPSLTGFPSFQAMQALVERLDQNHRVVFRLFRLGAAVEDTLVESVIPPKVLTAMVNADLLQKQGRQWQTPSLLIIPAESMILFVSAPAAYPTATKSCNIWFDLSSYVVARSLPVSLAGKSVLDICSGTGIQSLLCAARGAKHVLGLELSDDAVLAARANAVLNGLEERVEFRRSNMLEALDPGESFDFVVCNTPYAPVFAGDAQGVTLETLGNSVLMGLLGGLASHLSPDGSGILASWRAVGRRASTYQMHRVSSEMEKNGFSTFAYVDRAPDTPEGVLRIIQNDLQKRPEMQPAQITDAVNHIQALFQRSVDKMDGFYNQLIYFRKGRIESATAERAICGLTQSLTAGAA